MEMKKFKVLILYAGVGSNRKLWSNVDVTAIEYKQDIADVYKYYFPDDEVIVTDAHQYLLDHIDDGWDFVWASPPCPTHSRINNTLIGKGQIKYRYPDMRLYQEIIFLDYWFKGGLYCVENVVPYYIPLLNPYKVGNHLFWANFKINGFKEKARNTMSLGGMSRYNDSWIDVNQLKNIKSTRKDKVLQNMVDPKTGLHVLNCARNIITKSNIHQTDLFE